ncbi:MAG: peroxiredoxin [Candidatus Binatus sp.]|uniref:peroxiredoxin n=1 Tax=Candidatus Binatus sp. TaxID=2811406 RepID=UPI0027234249|nr:peroxiredoxin [Candidatus Binatus sp.]MDO8432404.1 peroxiredoxin [Candidatus Binatus sp.]
MIKVGQPAPDFVLPTQDGADLSLGGLRGHKVLLWFYPDAGSPGCTLEGRGFRDHQSYFDENNIRVVGISFNTPDENAAFAQQHNFAFPLLSDANRTCGLAYGACASLNATQPDRVSFLIDEHGLIERVYDQVDPRDHPARVLADILGV